MIKLPVEKDEKKMIIDAHAHIFPDKSAKKQPMQSAIFTAYK